MDKSVRVFPEAEVPGQPSLPDENTRAPRHSEPLPRAWVVEGIYRDSASWVLSLFLANSECPVVVSSEPKMRRDRWR